MLIDYYNLAPQGSFQIKTEHGRTLTFVLGDVQYVSDELGESILNNYPQYFRRASKDITTVFQTLDVSAGPATLTLLATSAYEANQEIVVKLSGDNQGTIATTGGELIDGLSTYTFIGNYSTVRLRRNAGSWSVISSGGSGGSDVLNIRSFAQKHKNKLIYTLILHKWLIK